MVGDAPKVFSKASIIKPGGGKFEGLNVSQINTKPQNAANISMVNGSLVNKSMVIKGAKQSGVYMKNKVAKSRQMAAMIVNSQS
jgi:hypothetical protein